MARDADVRAILMFFAVIHTGLLVVLGFGGDGLGDSGVQLPLGAISVLSSLMAIFFMEGILPALRTWVRIFRPAM